MDEFIKKLTNLLTIKSLVTLILTGVFGYLACTGVINADQILTIYSIVIAFYFGTQAVKEK